MATAVRDGELIEEEISVPNRRVDGPESPSDPFALGLSPERLTASAMAGLHAHWRTAPPLDPYTRLNYAENVRVRWNLHTNALEGSRVTYEDVSRIVVHKESVAGYTLREVAEVAGHDLALERMQALAATGAPLTETELKEWHRLLLGPDPAPLRDQYGNPHPVAAGVWKTGRNVIGLAGGGTRSTAEPRDVPRLMDHFLRRLHTDLDHVAAGRRDLLDVLAGTHSQFIEIHPFDDGNGRTGRLITSWQCLRAGVPVVIVPVSARDLYLEAMSLAAEGRFGPLRTLLAACLVRELDYAIAVAEGRADPTVANREADPERPVPPRGTGITGTQP